MEGVNIYIARKSIGRELAKKFPLSADVVIPVPDSARPVALGYAQELGIEFEEGLLKDRYSKKGKLRSFIEPYQKDREEITKWIIPIKEVIKDKEVIVVDDSIVRGTSSIAIVNAIRQAKAKKINMIVAYPSIRFPCYAGIDFPSSDELIAYTVSKDNNDDISKLVAKAINADFVGYNDPDTLAKAIGLPREELCFTCSTGDYSNLGLIEKPIFRSRKEVKGE